MSIWETVEIRGEWEQFESKSGQISLNQDDLANLNLRHVISAKIDQAGPKKIDLNLPK